MLLDVTLKVFEAIERQDSGVVNINVDDFHRSVP
jgi:hypothetical protein